MDAAYCTPQRIWKEIMTDQIEFRPKSRPSDRHFRLIHRIAASDSGSQCRLIRANRWARVRWFGIILNQEPERLNNETIHRISAIQLDRFVIDSGADALARHALLAEKELLSGAANP